MLVEVEGMQPSSGHSGEGQDDPEAGLRNPGLSLPQSWADSEPLVLINTSPRKLLCAPNSQMLNVI